MSALISKRMSAESVKLYVDAYGEFAKLRNSEKSSPYRILDYDAYQFRPSRPFGIRRFYCDAAEDSAREIANDIHDLRRFISESAFWLQVLGRYSDQERFFLTVEFIEVPFAHALSRPYALKHRFTYALAMLGTMYKARKGRSSDLKPFEKCDYKVAERLVRDWPGFAALARGLVNLNSEAFTGASSDFRNRDHHRMPPNIEGGHAPGARVEIVDGVPTFSAAQLQPLKLADLIPALTTQLENACSCMDLFWAVVSEREAKWGK